MGDVIWAGSFSGKVQTENFIRLSSNGCLDVFITKLDNHWNTVWAHCFGGPANDYLNAIAVNHTGDIYLTGTYRGEIIKEESKINSLDFSSDIFLAKYNTTGRFQFIESFGSAGPDFSKNLLANAGQSIFISGNFSAPTKKRLISPTGNNTKEDFFLSKWYDCSSSPKIQLPNDTVICGNEYTLIADSSFAEYYWNGVKGGNTLTIYSSGLYQLVVKDLFGCVSQDSLRVDFIDLQEVEYKNTSEQATFFKSLEDTTTIAFGDNILARIYPNPAIEEISIVFSNLPEHSNLQIKIYSSTGEIMWSEKINQVSGSIIKAIDLNSFKPGTYFVLIQIGYNSYLKKIIVM